MLAEYGRTKKYAVDAEMELDGNSHELRSKPGAPHRFAPENSEIFKFR